MARVGNVDLTAPGCPLPGSPLQVTTSHIFKTQEGKPGGGRWGVGLFYLLCLCVELKADNVFLQNFKSNDVLVFGSVASRAQSSSVCWPMITVCDLFYFFPRNCNFSLLSKF